MQSLKRILYISVGIIFPLKNIIYMNNKWLILINPIIAVLILSQAITGLNLFYPFLSRKAFMSLHIYGGYLLFTLVLIHFILNWFWFKNTFFKKKKAPPKVPEKPRAKPVKKTPEKSVEKAGEIAAEKAIQKNTPSKNPELS